MITGATGALGSWLTCEALRRGLEVVALLREPSLQDARRRLDGILDKVDPKTARAGLQVVQGDVHRGRCGLTSQPDSLPDLKFIVHCAACTSFDEKDLAESYSTNVEGTKNVLDLADSLRVPLVYISTAYVAGCREGLVRENELDTGQRFHNVYECTKCEAERLVHRWSTETGRPVIVLRPSIVVGDSHQGRTIRFNTLYDFMHAFELIASAHKSNELRVSVQGGVTKNFVPVDYFTQAAWHLIERAIPGTYHITHPTPPTLDDLRGMFADLFGVSRIRFVDDSEFEKNPPSRAERIYRRTVSTYAPYMAAEPRFDRTEIDAALSGARIDPPPIDVALLRRLLTYARSVNWGRTAKRCDAPPSAPAGIERYFNDFLSARMRQPLLPDLKSLSATFRIGLKEPTTHWTLVIERGQLVAISRNGAPASCTFLLNADTFGEIVSGSLAPQRAFFKRRIEIEGEMETGLMLATVLAEFFQRYPFDVQKA